MQFQAKSPGLSLLVDLMELDLKCVKTWPDKDSTFVLSQEMSKKSTNAFKQYLILDFKSKQGVLLLISQR